MGGGGGKEALTDTLRPFCQPQKKQTLQRGHGWSGRWPYLASTFSMGVGVVEARASQPGLGGLD